MLSPEDMENLQKFVGDSKKPWIWVDMTTTMGPTRLENYFRDMFDGEIIHHWSPTLPEGYLEIHSRKNIVIHWVLGEANKILKLQEMEDVDFDDIDEMLSSTIIQNSVIRLFSEKF